MKFSTLFFGVLTMALALLLGACKSRDYYVEKQVEKARMFVIDNERTLSPMQCEYIRFNKPEVMYENYFNDKDFFNTSITGGTEFGQMCIVWNVPGDDIPIIVFGVTTHGIRGWDPLRIIRRKFRTTDYPRENAVNNAVLYAMNNMLYLSDHMRNRIRFSSPVAITSTFPMDIEHREEGVRAATKNLTGQVSFIWPGEKKDEFVVVSGLCGSNYDKWIAVTGLVRNAKDIQDHTINELYKP